MLAKKVKVIDMGSHQNKEYTQFFSDCLRFLVLKKQNKNAKIGKVADMRKKSS